MFRHAIHREPRALNGHAQLNPLDYTALPEQAAGEGPTRTSAAKRTPSGDDCLIADIYRAAAGLYAWPAALENVAHSFGASFLQLFGVQKSSGNLAFSLHSDGTPLEIRRACFGKHHTVDLIAAEIDRLPVAVALNNRHSEHAALLAAPWYRDFWMPYGGRHILAGKLFDDGDLVAILQLIRGPNQQAFSKQEERRLTSLMMHLAAAIEALRRRHRLQTGTAVAELLLLRTHQPSFLLGAGGWILFPNAAAQRLLDKGTLLGERAGYLAATSLESDARLKLALNQTGVDRSVLALRDTARSRVVPGCLWSLASHNATNPFGPEAASLLILAAVADCSPPDPLALCAIFGFTPAEARVASRLLQGLPPKAIATSLGLSVPTVRHHIRKLLAKTEVRDLRELACRLLHTLEVCSVAAVSWLSEAIPWFLLDDVLARI